MRFQKKKSVYVFLSIVALCMLLLVVPVGAARAGIDGFSGEWSIDSHFNLAQDGVPEDIVVYTEDEIRIPLTADMFDWSDGRNTIPMEAVTMRELRNGRVRVNTKVRSGSKVLKYVQFDTGEFDNKDFKKPNSNVPTNKTAYISVQFADHIISVNDIDFAYEIYMTVDGEKSDDFTMTLAGTFKPRKLDVHEDMDYIDISDGTVAVAEDYVPNVSVNVGNGVSIKKNMTKGSKYYGISFVIDNMTLRREDYPDIYPIIHAVYEIETINMRYPNQGVTIKPVLDPKKPEITKFYVYDQDLKYLGTTDDTLAYSDLYILTTEQVPAFELDAYSQEFENAPNTQRATPETANTGIVDNAQPAKQKEVIVKKAFDNAEEKTVKVVSGPEKTDVTEVEEKAVKVLSGPDKNEEKANEVKVIVKPANKKTDEKTPIVVSKPADNK